MNNSSVPLPQDIKNGPNLYEKTFCTVWLMVIVYMIVRPITNNASLIRLIWIPSLLALFILSVRTKISTRFFVELVISVGIILFSMIAQRGAADQDHLLAAFCYINMFMVLGVCVNVKPSRQTFDFIFYTNIVLSILFFLYTFTPIAHRVHTNGVAWSSAYLVFDLGNSNLAAMNIFSFYCVLLINLAYRKHKLPILLLMAADLYMMYGTYCRSVLITVVIVTVGYFLIGKRKIPSWLLVVGVFIPAIFAVVYLSLYNRLGNQSIVLLDKSLFTGRQNNFLEYLGYINSRSTVIFGNFSQAGLQNAHNIIISILASLGVLGLISFFSFFIRTLLSINRLETTAVRTMSLICILGLFLQSSMEAAFFLGGFPGIMFLSTFVMISNYDDYTLRTES